MAQLLALVLGLVLACSTLARAEDDLPLDVVTQKVLSQNGVDSKILRPCNLVGKTSSRKDGKFFFSFEGIPGIEVPLDRDYWVLATWSAKRDNDIVGYMLNPTDGQSALNISMGHNLSVRSADTLSKDPGFSGIKSSAGVVGGQKVTWSRWSDQNHLHSECTFSMPSHDESELPGYEVNIVITANSEERRSALEDGMASLKLLYPKK